MFVASGSTDRKVPFVAVDATDLKTRETGLSSFTVYRSRDGGTATAYTTPTVAEASAANMPGLYWLTLDEDTTIAAGHDEEQYVVHITQASMAPVTLAVTLYRPKFTEGQSATMANNAVDADIERLQGTVVATPATAGILDVNVKNAGNTAWASGAITAASIASDAITAAKVATDVSAEIADAVWDEDATAHQTDGTFGQAIGDAAGGDSIWTAVDNLAGVANNTFNAVTNLPSSSAIATEIFDQGDGVETGLTFRQAMRLWTAALIGKLSGAGTGTETVRDFGDTKDRLVYTVDSDGNRSAVTRDAT